MHEAEDVAFGVFDVGEPADAGDRHFVEGDGSSELDCVIHGGIDRWDIDGADVGDDRLAVNFAAAHDHAAVDAFFGVGSGNDEPIGHGAVPLLELPVKELGIELDRALGLGGVDFEMDDAWHGYSEKIKYEDRMIVYLGPKIV